MQDLLRQETGLQYLETIFRYLFSTVEDMTVEEIKEIVEQTVSEEQGGFIMTLAEQLRNEGKEQGIQQGMQQGMLTGLKEGLLEGIEFAIRLKFPDEDCERVMPLIREIDDIHRLKDVKEEIKNAGSISELIDRLAG